MKLFDNIKSKIVQTATNVVTNVGNTIDRDKSMPGVQLMRGGLANNISNSYQQQKDALSKYIEPVPDKVRPIDFGREMVQNIVGIPKGFHKQWEDTESLYFPDRPQEERYTKTPVYTPETTPEKIGSFLYKNIAMPLVVGQATGTNQATKQGLETFSQIPQVNYALQKATDWIGQQAQKLKELEINAEELRKAYKTLGIDPSSDPQTAYRSLAKTHHPDLPTGSEEAMKVINSAYDKIESAGAVEKILSQLGVGPKGGGKIPLDSVLQAVKTPDAIDTSSTSIVPYGQNAELSQILSPNVSKVLSLPTPQTSPESSLKAIQAKPEAQIQPKVETQKTLDSLNPTGTSLTEYDPKSRAELPLGENMTTLDKTMNKSPNETITIYRGVSGGDQKDISPGDYITTNKQLAQDYAGEGRVISKEVKLSDILDDKTEPLGEEYIYKPTGVGTKVETQKTLDELLQADDPLTRSIKAILEKKPLDQTSIDALLQNNNSPEGYKALEPIVNSYSPDFTGSTRIPKVVSLRGGGTNYVTEPTGVTRPVRELNKKDTLELLEILKKQNTSHTPYTGLRLPAPQQNPMLPQPEQPPLLQPGQPDAPQPKQREISEILKPKSKVQKTIEDIILPSKNVLAKSGSGGKTAVELINRTEEAIDLASGDYIARLKPFIDKLNVEEKTTFADVVSGDKKAISKAQKEAAAAWREISNDIYEQANALGIAEEFIQDYFPHHIVKEPSDDVFHKVFGGVPRTAERRYGNIEMARQTDKPYDKDPSVLYDYIKNAIKRIEESKSYGTDDLTLYSLAQKTRDPQQSAKYIDQIIGKNQTSSEVGSALRGWQTISKLKPTTSLTNLTQNLSTIWRTDPQTVVKSIIHAFKNPVEAVLNTIRAGELEAGAERVFEDELGSGNLASKWIRFIGMHGTEKANRIIAVNSGIRYYEKLNQQALNGSKSALREIERLGMKVNGNPTKAGRTVSRETQFSTEPGELPYGWKTNLGKVLTQFKSFAYKHTGFLKDQGIRTVKEAVKGNFKPLLAFLVAYGITAPIAGEVVADLKALLSNKKRGKMSFAKRYTENILAATSFGLFDDLDALTGEYGEKGFISALFGPTASDVMSTAEIVTNIGDESEYNRRKAHRDLLKFVPLVGPTLSNTFVPNAYIDNILGPNTGLGEKDATTYLNLKNTSPQKAEEFKSRKQAEREKKQEKEKGRWLSNVLNKKEDSNWDVKPSTKEEAKEYKQSVTNALDEGVAPPKEAIAQALFNNKLATSKDYSERKAVYKALYNTLKDEEYPYSDEIKRDIIEASGATPEQYEYYRYASMTNDEKLEELLPQLGDLSDPENFTKLAIMRAKLAGGQGLTPGMIDYLYQDGLISKTQSDLLNALEYDELKQEFYIKRNSKFGSGSGGSKISYKQALKLYKLDLPSLNSNKSAHYSFTPSSNLIGNILSKRAVRAKLR